MVVGLLGRTVAPRSQTYTTYTLTLTLTHTLTHTLTLSIRTPKRAPKTSFVALGSASRAENKKAAKSLT